MDNSYEITIAGLKRKLTLCPVDESMDIAAFILFGDVEMTVAAGKELLERAPEFDVILTPEAKSIPLAYEMARQSGKPYVVARKGTKVYMRDYIDVEVQSITTEKKQRIFLGEDEIKQLKEKKVLIVDDVISTGGSLLAVREICGKAGGIVAACCAVLAEGDAAERKDIFFLAPLPLFFKKG